MKRFETIQITAYETPTMGTLTMADRGGGLAYTPVGARVVREADWRKLMKLARAVESFDKDDDYPERSDTLNAMLDAFRKLSR